MENQIDASTLPVVLNIPEVAKLLRCSKSGVYDLCKSDLGFPCFRVGKRVLVPRDLLLEWIEQQVAQNAEKSGFEDWKNEPFKGYREAMEFAKLNSKRF